MIGIKPSNALFFGAAVLCLLVARRWLQTGVVPAALVPGLIVLALWKQRGLGELPAFSSTGRRRRRPGRDRRKPAARRHRPPVDRYVNLDWHHLHQNIDGVREFFWAVRPLEFIVFAGLHRRSDAGRGRRRC